MQGRSIQRSSQRAAARLLAAEPGYPFGPDWEVWTVAGKVFMLLTEVQEEPVVILKCEPAHGLALRATVEGVSPGYHMNKRHWITLRGSADVDQALVDELVRNSYRLVLEGLPKRARPRA